MKRSPYTKPARLAVALCPGCKKNPSPAGWHLDADLPPLRCASCIRRDRAEVERFAAAWSAALMASLAMTGHWPEIDPSLLRSAS